MPEFLDLHGKVTKALRSLAEGAMRRHGLHLGQNHLLAALWVRDGLTPGEIAAALHVTAPTVVKMATRMAAAGLLTRRREDRDNRLVRLWLTDAGRSLRGPIEAERWKMEEKVTADLTEAERAQLLSALAKIQRSATALIGDESDSADHIPR
jgi:MarR family transcriptional regulator, organic hydroperoxide resistance regulator